MNKLYTFNRELFSYDTSYVRLLSDIYTNSNTRCIWPPISHLEYYSYIILDWNSGKDLQSLFNLRLCTDLKDEIFFLDHSVSYPRSKAFKRTRSRDKSSCIVTPIFTQNDYSISDYYILRDSDTGAQYLLEKSSEAINCLSMSLVDFVRENNPSLYSKISKMEILNNTFLEMFKSLSFESTARVLKFRKNLSFLVDFNPLEGIAYIPLDILFKLSEPEEFSIEKLEIISNGIYSKDIDSCRHALLTLINSNVMSFPKEVCRTLLKDGLERVKGTTKRDSRLKLVKNVLEYNK